MTYNLQDFVVLTQRKLFKKLCTMYRKQSWHCKGNFVLVKGTAPVLLVAHLDTVHVEPVRQICFSSDGNILMSPQGIGGDDRCGVYALVKIYETTEVKPWLLFCCDEEIGGLGAQMFCTLYAKGQITVEFCGVKFIVEIDRRGSDDAVFYDCANLEFEEYISTFGYETASGSFSDISWLAPALGVAAVNLSSGYHNAHTRHEYINRSELERTIERVRKMVVDATLEEFPAFEYVDATLSLDDDEDDWNYF